MTIRNKILRSFSATTIVLLAAVFGLIYWLFAAYREEEFQQKQNLKIQSTIHLIHRYKKESEAISSILDAQDINDFYDEKLLVFDSDKQLIFSSLDNLNIQKRRQILEELSPSKRWIETKEGEYDLIGVYLEYNNKGYYAISKAYDIVGYDKLNFMRKVLLIVFVVIAVIVIFVSLYLANNLSRPINRLAFALSRYDLSKEGNKPIIIKRSTGEIAYLTDRFNELLTRTKAAFAFQKNTINHISHQLKTPVAVLVSELEKLQQENDIGIIKEGLTVQTERAKSFGDVISTLLEITKIESGVNFHAETIRIDEILFELIEEAAILCPAFHFQIRFAPESFLESQVELTGNRSLLKQALQNLLVNSIKYADNEEVEITVDVANPERLKVIFFNSGKGINPEERKLLFHYFFRGENSRGKSGNGLGLVLAEKIVSKYRGHIYYLRDDNKNIFTVEFIRQPT